MLSGLLSANSDNNISGTRCKSNEITQNNPRKCQKAITKCQLCMKRKEESKQEIVKGKQAKQVRAEEGKAVSDRTDAVSIPKPSDQYNALE